MRPLHDRSDDRAEREELHLLREEVELLRDILKALRHPSHPPTLASIKIHFGAISMPVGPVVINVGQSVTATVVGFDQNGAPFAGPIPTPTFSIDDSTIASLDPNSGVTTGLAAGVANVTATVAGPNGPLTDTESVTVTAVVPVLSSVKISFA